LNVVDEKLSDAKEVNLTIPGLTSLKIADVGSPITLVSATALFVRVANSLYIPGAMYKVSPLVIPVAPKALLIVFQEPEDI